MYNFTSHSDRRRFQRLSMNLSVNYRVVRPTEIKMRIGDQEIEAEMMDISAGGMSILTDRDIPASTVLHLKFSLFKIDKNTGSAVFFRPFETKGQVRSSIALEKGRRLGICFYRFDSDTGQEMREIAKTATLN